MRINEALGGVVEMARTQRLRAAIIVVCTAAGVGFLVAIVAIVGGLGRHLEHNVIGKMYGFNTVQVRREVRDAQADTASQEIARPSRALTVADAEWLASRIPVGGTLAYSYSGSGEVRRAGVPSRKHLKAEILAASAGQFVVQSLDVRQGRPFTDYEAQRGATVAVLGAEVALRLFGAGVALNQIVDVANVPFRVVGVLVPRGKFLGFSMDNLVVVPAQSRMNGMINRQDEVDAIAFRVPHDSLLAPAALAIEGAMRMRRGLQASEKVDFDVSSSETLMDGWRRIRKILLIAGPTLIGMALIVAVLVTMNIMLVVVTERVPEIGLRRALGARRADILIQFLAEAIVLALLGGCLGILLGAGGAGAVRAFASIPATVGPWLALLGLGVSVVVGMSAGAYPAYRASSLAPIEALGRE